MVAEGIASCGKKYIAFSAFIVSCHTKNAEMTSEKISFCLGSYTYFYNDNPVTNQERNVDHYLFQKVHVYCKPKVATVFLENIL